MALNVRLHHAHDLGLSQDQPLPRWYRYADNLLYPCQSVSEGCQILDRSRTLLEKGGFALKGENGGPIDLRENEAQLLGFTLSSGTTGIRFAPGRQALHNLRQSLSQAQATPNPSCTARQVIQGWLDAMGPAFERSREKSLLTRVFQMGIDCGFREIDSYQSLRTIGRSSGNRWQILRTRIAREILTNRGQQRMMERL
jgi:hypothetical protein